MGFPVKERVRPKRGPQGTRFLIRLKLRETTRGLARGFLYVLIRVRGNPFGAFNLRRHETSNHCRVLLERHRGQFMAGRTLNDRAHAKDQLQHGHLLLNRQLRHDLNTDAQRHLFAVGSNEQGGRFGASIGGNDVRR